MRGMSTSVAVAVWIPRLDFEVDALTSLLADRSDSALEYALHERADLRARLLVASLEDQDEGLQTDLDAFDATAKAIAAGLRVPVYLLHASYGFSDFLAVKRFEPKGTLKWSTSSARKASTDVLRTLTRANPQAVAMTEANHPYWKLISEIAPAFREDALRFGLKPAFDVGPEDGWTTLGSFFPGDELDPAAPSAAVPRRATSTVETSHAPPKKKAAPRKRR